MDIHNPGDTQIIETSSVHTFTIDLEDFVTKGGTCTNVLDDQVSYPGANE